MNQPLLLGGLDIRDLRLFNEALLGKWLWRFMTEKDNLWRKVVTIKYGDNGFGWFPSIVRGSYRYRRIVFGDLSPKVGGDTFHTVPFR